MARGQAPPLADAFFLVDPLDGTREFINRRGEFTVNVALIVGQRPVFGIVYAPALAELYVTLAPTRAAFARLAPDAAVTELGSCGLAEIRTRRPDVDALTAVASRSHLTAETDAFLSRYRVATRRNAGSSLKFGLLARGAADIYPRLGATMEWDTAAGHAILLAAGGAVTTLEGAALCYGKVSEGLRNPHFVAWGSPAPILPRS
jgi:3'(2'), 5'-bisphosphate nucleotidase